MRLPILDALPASMAAMGVYPHFVLWRAVPRADGRVDKVPCNTQGHPASAHDPANQMDYETCRQHALRLDLGVGYAFNSRNPFFFLDFDHCKGPDGNWSAFAVSIFQRFSGCAFEVSQSGEGFHVFGSYTQQLQHKNKRADLGLELYVTDRFVALTGISAQGDSGTDAQEQYRILAAEFFAIDPAAATVEADWTTGPVPDWSGPEDDTELLALMWKRRPTAQQAFNNAATIPQLWHADEEALTLAFPDPNRADGGAYGKNEADLALLAQLAFYTGKNAERMQRLFGQSDLANRDKWRDREDYQIRSILIAISGCSNVYSRRPERALPPENHVIETERTIEGSIVTARVGLQYLAPDQQLDYFRGCVYVKSRHQIFEADGTWATSAQFKARHGGYVYQLDHDGDSTRNAFEAFTESRVWNHPKVNGTMFRPELAPGSIVSQEGLTYVNTYLPPQVTSVEGDVSRFLDLMHRQYPNDDDFASVMAYAAAVVQFPGIKFQWCPVSQGTPGNGKSFVLRVIARSVGERYTYFPNPLHIDSHFNGWLAGRIFVGVEEIHHRDKPEIMATLLIMITQDRMELEDKGISADTGDNRANFWLCSNYRDAILKTLDDRRFSIHYTAQQNVADLAREGMLGDYFPNLYRWFNAEGGAFCTNYLQNYSIPDELNPAVGAHRAPVTSSTPEALRYGQPWVQRMIGEAIDEYQYGCRGSWVSTTAIKLIFERSKKPSNVQIREALEALDYVPHPGLPGGRVTKGIPAEEGRRPRLYVPRGSLLAQLTNPTEIVAKYLAAQQVEGVPPTGGVISGTGNLAV